MGFSTDTRNIKTMYCYEDAVRAEASIKPLSKGDKKGLKPLAERNKKHLNIRRESVIGQQGDDIVVKFYQTDIVRYRPDGTILVDFDTYNTQSSRKVAEATAGIWLYSYDNRIWAQLRRDGTTEYYPLLTRGVNVFQRGDGTKFSGLGLLKLLNPQYPVKHVLKRAEFREITKRYKAFRTYLMGAFKLREFMQPTREEAVEVLGTHHDSVQVETMMQWILDASETQTESWYKASVMLLRCASPRTWRPVILTEAQVKREFKDVLFTHHRDEVFEKVTVTDGSLVKDVNARYFKKYWV